MRKECFLNRAGTGGNLKLKYLAKVWRSWGLDRCRYWSPAPVALIQFPTYETRTAFLNVSEGIIASTRMKCPSHAFNMFFLFFVFPHIMKKVILLLKSKTGNLWSYPKILSDWWFEGNVTLTYSTKGQSVYIVCVCVPQCPCVSLSEFRRLYLSVFVSGGAYLTVCEYVNVRGHCVILRVTQCVRMFASLIMSGSVCVYICACVYFWWVTTDTAASSSGATFADNSVSLPEASGSANKLSCQWPHPHPASTAALQSCVHILALHITLHNAQVTSCHPSLLYLTENKWYLLVFRSLWED